MKPIIQLILFLSLISACNNAGEKQRSLQNAAVSSAFPSSVVESISDEQSEEMWIKHSENEEDKLISLLKENYLISEGVSEDAWFDLKCTYCKRRCCSPCTADGDRKRCSKTKFQNCRVCGHASSLHGKANH